jgi:hypothetical protein
MAGINIMDRGWEGKLLQERIHLKGLLLILVVFVVSFDVLSGVWAGVAPVPKTGQVNCYDSEGKCINCTGTGQDGEYHQGVNVPGPRFTDGGDGTVTDNSTNLIWTKDAQQIKGTMKWSAALAACNNLNFAGHTDWRLPNVKELLSLIDYGAQDPALPPGHPFVNVQLIFYWTSSTYEATTDHAWGVYVYNGYVYNYHKITRAYVWPVRGGR